MCQWLNIYLCHSGNCSPPDHYKKSYNHCRMISIFSASALPSSCPVLFIIMPIVQTLVYQMNRSGCRYTVLLIIIRLLTRISLKAHLKISPCMKCLVTCSLKTSLLACICTPHYHFATSKKKQSSENVRCWKLEHIFLFVHENGTHWRCYSHCKNKNERVNCYSDLRSTLVKKTNRSDVGHLFVFTKAQLPELGLGVWCRDINESRPYPNLDSSFIPTHKH